MRGHSVCQPTHIGTERAPPPSRGGVADRRGDANRSPWAAISPEVATDSDPVEVFGRRAELSGTLDGFREGNGSAYGSRSPGWGCGIGCRRQGGPPERNRPPASGRARDRQRVLSGEIAVPGDRGRQNIVGAVIGWRISPSICSNLTAMILRRCPGLGRQADGPVLAGALRWSGSFAGIHQLSQHHATA
jgi:hypothetical protein